MTNTNSPAYYNPKRRPPLRSSIRDQVHNRHHQRACSLPTSQDAPLTAQIRSHPLSPPPNLSPARRIYIFQNKTSFQLHWELGHYATGRLGQQMLPNKRADLTRQSSLCKQKHNASWRKVRNLYYTTTLVGWHGDSWRVHATGKLEPARECRRVGVDSEEDERVIA